MNTTEPPLVSPPLLPKRFEEIACRHAQRVAIDIPPSTQRPARVQMTYGDLAREVFTLAHWLRERLAGEGLFVLLLDRDTPALYVAQLAVLAAGGAYTCLEPSLPDERLQVMARDARPVRVITDRAGVDRARRIAPRPDDVVAIEDSLDDRKTSSPPSVPWLGPESLAYVIYTSGTTGQPKGVMIEHRSIANLVASDVERFALGPEDRVVQGSSPAYDSSVEEIWLAFAAGATLVVMDREAARLGPDLVPWLQREGVTVLCPPPTLLRATGCRRPDLELPDLRLLYVGGEALTSDIAGCWARGRWLENGYGPTECTVTVLRGRVKPGAPISIGKPICGHRAWALDPKLMPVPDGEPGELCIAGVGLARGYLGDPKLTAARFVEHPRFGRVYRTADRVRREPDGSFAYLGRLDTQVKLRGHRVELEEIETCLTSQPGIREAACTVRSRGAQSILEAWLVVDEPALPPDSERLRVALNEALPVHMVPARFRFVESLPRTSGDKLDRNALEDLAPLDSVDPSTIVPPTGEVEQTIVAAMEEALGLERSTSVIADFFDHLGGDSLSAAMTISRLRETEQTAHLTVRDLYEARTARSLAERLREDAASSNRDWRRVERTLDRKAPHPIGATIVQLLWLLSQLLVGAAGWWLAAFLLLPWLLNTLGVIGTLVTSPVLALLGFLLWSPLAVGLAVMAKKLLIGTYRACREPVYGSFYVRHWIVQHIAQLVPWRWLSGTTFQCAALRLLGARIGRRVHFHRGVHLTGGGWDLLSIADDVSIAQDAALRLVDLDDGELVSGPVTIGEGASLEVRASVAPHTTLEPGAQLSELSSLPSGGHIPAGARFDGVPARPAGPAEEIVPPVAGVQPISNSWHGILTILGNLTIDSVLALPAFLILLTVVTAFRLDAPTVLDWLFSGDIAAAVVVPLVAITVISVPLGLITQALLVRSMGRVRPDVISRWSLAYLRVWFKTGLLQSAGIWLSGSLFWPPWLRLAGMRLGRGCEVSTIIDVVPELVVIGDESFLADGVYLGAPRLRKGLVRLEGTRLGRETFLGNHVVVPSGQSLPDDLLLGICTVADDRRIVAGTAWFGHPAFRLPKREIIEMDRSLTHDPGWIRYLTRVFWETLRAGLPVVPLFALLAWFKVVAHLAESTSTVAVILLTVPLSILAVAASFCLIVLLLKWLLLGRVRTARHPFWSCWCGRWDLLYVVWGFWVRGILAPLEGTLLLAWYLRAMGCRIGRRCVLGHGFAQVVDPDMIDIDDGSTFNGLFQAHSFEDRVLKIDRIHIHRDATVAAGAVLLYGADIGAGASVAAHSVVMKRERLSPGERYEGCPTQPVS